MVVMIATGSRPPPPGEEEGNNQSKSKRAALASGIGVTGPPLPLDELLPKSDFLSLHLPLTVDTKGMIAERELALMKTSAVVINAARGGVVDEQGALRMRTDVWGTVLHSWISYMIPSICVGLSPWTAVQDSILGVVRNGRVADAC